jgi:hypothetical protein
MPAPQQKSSNHDSSSPLASFAVHGNDILRILFHPLGAFAAKVDQFQ